MEEWRDVKGYEGYYQVSNLGRVRSLDRLVAHSRNGEFKVKRKGKVMAAVDHGNGYVYVTLIVGNKRKNHYVHRLVAEAFVDNPFGLSEIDHFNRDRADNRAENLRWVTHFENMANSTAVGRRQKRKPTNTGIEYITFTKGRYCFQYQRKEKKIYKQFNTLEEAVDFKDSLQEVVL